MPWKCPICGYDNADDAIFCIQCGAKRPDAVQQPTGVAQQATVVQQESQQTVEQQPTQAEVQSAPPAPSQATAEQAPQVEATAQAQQPSGKYYLQFIATPASSLNKMKIPLDFEVFENVSIGRSPENVIVIPDPEVSRRHAIISLVNGKLYIEDLNSTNGTYVYDGKLFQPVKGKQEIQPNAVIKLGNSTIVKIVRE